MDSLKGPGAVQHCNGSSLRIAIVHARWNSLIISSLVSAARSALLSAGVSPHNIVTESVPGAYELPFACQKVIAASQIQASSSSLANFGASITGGDGGGGVVVTGVGRATQDLLGGTSSDLLANSAHVDAQSQQIAGEKHGEKAAEEQEVEQEQHQQRQPPAPPPLSQPFDAVIAIGVLIKGETMHFEYIADAVSHGLMRVQLDTGVPVVFGLLTVLTEEQGMARAGMNGGHNHGNDWGHAAVEVASKRRRWGNGTFS